jgi:succinate-semialdehyde dehydrogenase/glutarate-semialdehyde dehydrogenase
MEPPVQLLIDGKWRAGSGGRKPVIDPAKEEPMGAVELASESEVDSAVAAADRAFGGWASFTGAERGAILIKAARLLESRLAEIARLLTLEQGKTLAESRGELTRSVETLAWNGEEAGRIEGTSLPGKAHGATRSRLPVPVGVVAAFAAWNFPAVLATRKLGAALAAGCTVVLKAAEEAPYTSAAIVQCLIEAGIPAGAVNLLFGDPPRLASRLLTAPAVRKVTFTGSTRVGKELAKLAGADLKRCTFELGGHAPLIFCEDGDLETGVKSALAFKFTSAGQSCIAPSRFYIHRRRHDEFVARFVAAAAAIKPGNGFEEGVTMGPLANASRVAAMERFVADAVAKGARIVLGGQRLNRPGYFFAPTVLAEVAPEAAVMNEEPFGPIAPMAAFDSIDEALAQANRLAYGFAAYVFTNNLAIAERAATALKAGNIGINQMCPSLPDAPIGGVGDSGYGYEGGREGIEAFLHFKLVSRSIL